MRKAHKAIAIFNGVDFTLDAIMKINREKGNEFILMSYTSQPKATDKGNSLMVVIPMPFSIYSKVYADLAWEKGWRKGAMVVNTGTYGDEWRDVFREDWVKKGGIITTERSTNYYKRTEFSASLAHALATDPDFLFIGGPSSTTAMIIEQSRAKGFEGGFIMIDQSKMDAIYTVFQKPLTLEGTVGLAMSKDIPYPASGTFMQDYKTNYKRNVTWENVLHYTAMYALARAIAEAGTVDNVYAIRAAFSRVFPMLGDRYPIEFFGISPHGRLYASAFVQTVKHGKFTQPVSYVWWAKTQKEFDNIRKTTKGSTPLIWKQIN